MANYNTERRVTKIKKETPKDEENKNFSFSHTVRVRCALEFQKPIKKFTTVTNQHSYAENSITHSSTLMESSSSRVCSLILYSLLAVFVIYIFLYYRKQSVHFSFGFREN